MNIKFPVSDDTLSTIQFRTFAVTLAALDGIPTGTLILVLNSCLVAMTTFNQEFSWGTPGIRTLPCRALQKGESFKVII